jgi:asparagine N-glycosylation enzyme membrane subunit Stt3
MPIYPLRFDRGEHAGRVLIDGVETTLAIPQQIDRLALQLGCEVDWSRAVNWPHAVTTHGGLEAFSDLGQAVVDAQRALRDYRRYATAERWANAVEMLRGLVRTAEAMAAQGGGSRSGS